MFIFDKDEDDDKVTAGDTVDGVIEGVKDGDAGDAAEAIKDDALQTKDNIGDAINGEDGDNR